MIERKDLGGGRGLGMYGDPVKTSYGDVVEVQDSSAASGPHCWLRIHGSTHLSGPVSPLAGLEHGVAPGSLSAHLSVAQARAIRDRLNAWLGDEPGGKSQREEELEAVVYRAIKVLEEDPKWM